MPELMEMILGLANDRQSILFTDSEWLQHTAVHEADHAVMAVHFGFPLGSVSIEAGDFYAGITHASEATHPHFMSLGEPHNAGLKFRSTNTAIFRNQKVSGCSGGQ